MAIALRNTVVICNVVNIRFRFRSFDSVRRRIGLTYWSNDAQRLCPLRVREYGPMAPLRRSLPHKWHTLPKVLSQFYDRNSAKLQIKVAHEKLGSNREQEVAVEFRFPSLEKHVLSIVEGRGKEDLWSCVGFIIFSQLQFTVVQSSFNHSANLGCTTLDS